MKLKDFRFISMVGIMYKIILKFFLRRTKGVMNNLVGESQFFFIEGKQIFDGITVVNEVIEFRVRFKNKMILFKFDFHNFFYFVEFSRMGI